MFIGGSGFVPIIIYSSFFEGTPLPPVSDFMLTEMTSSMMISESGDEMITE